ncbi:hypothetical protein TH24_22245 [Thalassospira xiamenensis]|nr:hypothetical protein TH24_22245 [Thalassospira xiamenensis]
MDYPPPVFPLPTSPLPDVPPPPETPSSAVRCLVDCEETSDAGHEGMDSRVFGPDMGNMRARRTISGHKYYWGLIG